MSSLEKNCDAKQESIDKAEVKYSVLLAKYEAAPKVEVMDKYRADVERLTDELKEVKDMMNE